MSEKIRNVDPSRPALDVEQDAAGTPALAVRNKATSGHGGAIDVQHANASAPAIRVRGAGDLLDLRDASGASVFAVSQAGAITALNIHPVPASGQYFYPVSPLSTGTSSGLGVGTLRVVPFVVPRALAISRVVAEVTSAGEAGSLFRIGIYSASGNIPSSLVVDAGTIAGDSATVQEIAVSVTLAPGVYFVGGAVQNVATTQPTMRTCGTWTPPILLNDGSSLPSANATTMGYRSTGVTGALASTFSLTGASNSAPRIILKAT